jgi:predicted CXXCH cytochrome family protein
VIAGADGGTCGACHNTQASAALRGWANAASTPSLNGWYSRTISKLCYGCHGGVSVGGSHDVTNTVFANGNTVNALGDPYVHLYTPGRIWDVDGVAAENYSATGFPYTRAGGSLECTSCHNVHNDDGAPFLNRTSMGGAVPAAGSAVGGLCSTCHLRYNAGNVGAANTGGTGGRSLHPTNISFADLPGNLATTIINPIDADLRIAIPGLSGAGWALGGHLTTTQDGSVGGAGGFSCQTCHAVHGTGAGTLQIPDLLAINNYPRTPDQPSALCVGCHGGPTNGNTVGTGTDHPIDTDPGRPFYPTGVTLPVYWTDNTDRDRQASPFYTDGSPTCSSCHDAHGGITATSLLRRPQNSPDGWCFECHNASSVIPAYHHSNTANDTDFRSGTSALGCGDCHGGGLTSTWSAHNGFWDFEVAPDEVNGSGVIYQSLCQHCHSVTDPTAIIGYAANFPSTHGNVAGGSESHLCSTYPGNRETDDNSTFNSWIRGNAWPETDGQRSKAGNWNGAYSGWDIVCESCHNLLYNAAFTKLTADRLGGGWKLNLLLAAYEDDGSGNLGGADEVGSWDGAQTGDALCRGCHFTGADQNSAPAPGSGNYVHYPAAHTTENFSYNPIENPYGRPSSVLLTSYTAACPDKSTADMGFAPGSPISAPGVMSYPANNRLNCDSCHRPHDADPQGATGGYGFVILENGSTAGAPKTDACDQCHDTQVQCQ